MYQPQDFFFRKAKAEGYPARSVYKLSELDQKYNLFKPNQAILDLGCAPGSWSIYISRQIGPQGKIIGIDLKETQIEADNFFFFRADVLEIDEERLATIMEEVGLDKFDGLVSDMAPSTSGIKGVDAGRSAILANQALNISRKTLKKGGFLVLKILEGGEHQSIWRETQRLFAKQKQIRPKAVRQNSREIYIVAYGFKGA
ncbi:MAG: RlmE family RNA methyltransferase [Patescibacteria group bacterium]|nr:RlmE family RNA methyltransferase [Patescibacteria group bacterium]